MHSGEPSLFLSADWGTSFLRVRLASIDGQNVIAGSDSNNGIRTTFHWWKQRKDADPVRRVAFYLGILRESIYRIEEQLGGSLAGTPVVLSGMASSSAGLVELPYAQTPFATDGRSVIAQWLDLETLFLHPVLLVSGIRNTDDVMRGEETQLIGCNGSGDGWYIFPGTHSKHILVKDDAIVDFCTYMTGEFFGLLSEMSLLSGSVEKSEGPGGETGSGPFQQGVLDAGGANLLRAAFRVRTNDLFGKLSAKENYNYLSGLLIGAELQDLAVRTKASGLRGYMCCGPALKDYYEKAVAVLDLCERVHIFPSGWVDTAVVRGQSLIFHQLDQS
ncbi:MAG: 2-dehydro-3-deoxygalactonokinase [Bacteroidota bacterium]|nr:2-dehydro-3-deoxygalactonokinase [Bacteroidota bacterium]